jgi:NAD-dependent dihydropyrimidine dehydrogenase PreA subunit
MRYLTDRLTLALDRQACRGCGRCLEVCPHGVFVRAPGERAVRYRDRAACMECGACARNCPAGAVAVEAGVGCATAILRGAVTGTEECCCGGGGEGKALPPESGACCNGEPPAEGSA